MLLDDALEAPRPQAKWLKPLKIGVGIVVVVALGGAIVFAAMQETTTTTKKSVHQIAILKPPPPPPPPKVEEKLPEPEIKEEVKVPEPDQMPDVPSDQPPGEQLGVDAEGSGSGDSFGLVGKPGGKDITTIGGGDTGGDKHAWYAGVVGREIERELARAAQLRGITFKAQIRIWVGSGGRVSRAELAGSSGNADTDRRIRESLDGIRALSRTPPADMPQPVILLATSRH